MNARCSSHAPLTAVVVLAALVASTPSTGHAFVTEFGRQVNAAIDRGLEWFRAHEQNGSIGGDATGLALLALLERRTSADWDAPALGYRGMDAEDQALAERSVRWMIANIDGFGRVETPESYPSGSALMALSVYLATDGPDNVGANVGVGQAIAIDGGQVMH